MTLNDSSFLRACRRLPVAHTPVWFMRQAGRSLPEYRRLRADVPMLEACNRPDMVVEITLQPVRRYDVDAAILFSDIVVPLHAIGVDLDIKSGVGPVVAEPIRDADAVKQLRELEPEDVSAVAEAAGQLVEELGSRPLIGFAGGPFTLASYLVEGGPSRNHQHTKALMYGEPDLWEALMKRLSAITLEFLRVQIRAGASAVQLFDSWVGALSPRDYRENVLPHTRWIFDQLADLDIPRIHYGVGTGELLGLLSSAGADVVGVDWRVPLDKAAHRVEPHTALQGNLDPAVLFAPWPVIEERARRVIESGAAAESHIFNLGHGVIPTTDPDMLARLTEFVHSETSR
ncbi:uroporphyrinogen decarboxylase [Spiractinospora alimapuensis]|nr:uroporphyrinogen decarboxylase [Spiractinospora alimapuensis]QVQ52426.1 uroporphyrinogen decarboxylase [Spiractinospora alimapuensis]